MCPWQLSCHFQVNHREIICPLSSGKLHPEIDAIFFEKYVLIFTFILSRNLIINYYPIYLILRIITHDLFHVDLFPSDLVIPLSQVEAISLVISGVDVHKNHIPPEMMIENSLYSSWRVCSQAMNEITQFHLNYFLF